MKKIPNKAPQPTFLTMIAASLGFRGDAPGIFGLVPLKPYVAHCHPTKGLRGLTTKRKVLHAKGKLAFTTGGMRTDYRSAIARKHARHDGASFATKEQRMEAAWAFVLLNRAKIRERYMRQRETKEQRRTRLDARRVSQLAQIPGQNRKDFKKRKGAR